MEIETLAVVGRGDEPYEQTKLRRFIEQPNSTDGRLAFSLPTDSTLLSLRDALTLIEIAARNDETVRTMAAQTLEMIR